MITGAVTVRESGGTVTDIAWDHEEVDAQILNNLDLNMITQAVEPRIRQFGGAGATDFRIDTVDYDNNGTVNITYTVRPPASTYFIPTFTIAPQTTITETPSYTNTSMSAGFDVSDGTEGATLGWLDGQMTWEALENASRTIQDRGLTYINQQIGQFSWQREYLAQTFRPKEKPPMTKQEFEAMNELDPVELDEEMNGF